MSSRKLRPVSGLVEETARTHGKHARETFDRIYAANVWEDATSPKGGGGSGPGSSLKFTARTRALVESLLWKYNIGMLIDAPCGAMKWMSVVVDRVTNQNGNPDFQYLGLDIVKSVIENNRMTYRKFDNMHFEVQDLSQDLIEVPSSIKRARGQRTAIFSRDALQHLNFDLIVSTLKNFAASHADFLIVGSYHGVGMNRNITTGDYFAIDMTQAPFVTFLPLPLEVVDEETPDHKHMVVYDIKELAQVDFDGMLRAAKELYRPHL